MTFVPPPITVCAVCGQPTRSTTGELTFDRDGFTITVTGVPMSVCDGCGERYVAGPLAVALSNVIDALAEGVEAAARDAQAIVRPRSLVLQAAEVPDLLIAS